MRNIIMLLSCLMDLILVFYCIFSKSNRTKVGLLCGILAFVLLIGTFYLLMFPRYEKLKPTGEYEVATKVITFTDETQTLVYAKESLPESVTCGIWYPDSKDIDVHTCPLVLFSHGSFGTRSNNESMYHELASHGYVVCSLDHLYQSFSCKDENGKKTKISFTYLNELMKEDATKNPEGSYHSYQKWMKARCSDINLVIDQLLALSEQENSERVFQLIDGSRMGIAGHSMGGAAALAMGRQNDKIKAVMALEAPFMYDITGVSDGKLVFTNEEYPVPVLNVYSDASYANISTWPQYAQNARYLQDEDPKTLNVHISGAGHLTLCDLSIVSPFLTRVLNGQSSKLSGKECLTKVNAISLSFFDCYLKGKGTFVESDWN